MAKCVSGLQDTVALQRQENTDTRRHLKEVLDKYEHQREVSFRTQKTFEDLMESKLSRDQQETSKVQSDYGVLRGDYEEVKYVTVRFCFCVFRYMFVRCLMI